MGFWKSYILWCFGALTTTLIFTLLMPWNWMKNKKTDSVSIIDDTEFIIDPNFGKYTDNFSLGIQTAARNNNKGEVTISNNLNIEGHYLRSAIKIVAYYHPIPADNPEPSYADIEMGTIMNHVHQNILMRRIDDGMLFESPVDMNDFHLLELANSIFIERLTNASYLSIKYITFVNWTDVESAIGHIKANKTFDILALTATSGFLSYTRNAAYTHKYINCVNTIWQFTDIIRMTAFPKAPLCPDVGNNPGGNVGQVDMKAGRCVHITKQVTGQKDRNIPSSLISILLCH